MNDMPISYWGVAAAYGILIIPLAILLWVRVPLIGRTLIGGVRMTVQLLLVGFYLQVVFRLNNPWLNVAWVLVMLFVADISIIRGAGLRFRKLALPIYVLIAMRVLDYALTRQIRLTGTVLEIAEIAIEVVSLLAIAYTLSLLMSLAAEVVVKFLHKRSAGFDSQLIRLAFRLLFWVITLMAIALISERIGIPVAALAAGIGVGGLAFALAAQSTLENLVAGLTLYGDRPIRVGELCEIGGVTGNVESIGLRSTRLRTFARTVVTIPNAEVAKYRLENFAMRDRMLMQTTIGLRYETTPDQMRYVLGKLRELLYAHPKVLDDGMRVRKRNSTSVPHNR